MVAEDEEWICFNLGFGDVFSALFDFS